MEQQEIKNSQTKRSFFRKHISKKKMVLLCVFVFVGLLVYELGAVVGRTSQKEWDTKNYNELKQYYTNYLENNGFTKTSGPQSFFIPPSKSTEIPSIPATPAAYVKKLYTPDDLKGIKDILQSNPTFYNLVARISDSNLLGMRCSPYYEYQPNTYNNIQANTYTYQLSGNNNNITVIDPYLISLLNEYESVIPVQAKATQLQYGNAYSVEFCDLSNGERLINYVVNVPMGGGDGYVGAQEHFGGPEINVSHLPYTGCSLMEINVTGTAYYSCGQADGAGGQSEYFSYDMNSGIIIKYASCMEDNSQITPIINCHVP